MKPSRNKLSPRFASETWQGRNVPECWLLTLMVNGFRVDETDIQPFWCAPHWMINFQGLISLIFALVFAPQNFAHSLQLNSEHDHCFLEIVLRILNCVDGESVMKVFVSSAGIEVRRVLSWSCCGWTEGGHLSNNLPEFSAAVRVQVLYWCADSWSPTMFPLRSTHLFKFVVF